MQGLPPTDDQVGYKRSAFIGSCKHEVWQAIRASSAAPYYLDDFSDGILYLYCNCLNWIILWLMSPFFLTTFSMVGIFPFSRSMVS